jgi:hypothetical protein
VRESPGPREWSATSNGFQRTSLLDKLLRLAANPHAHNMVDGSFHTLYSEHQRTTDSRENPASLSGKARSGVTGAGARDPNCGPTKSIGGTALPTIRARQIRQGPATHTPPVQTCPAAHITHAAPQRVASLSSAQIALGPVPHLWLPARQVIPQAKTPEPAEVSSQIRVGLARGGSVLVQGVHAPPQLATSLFARQVGGVAAVVPPHV